MPLRRQQDWRQVNDSIRGYYHWLKDFKLKRVDTEIQRAGAGRYSLAKEPVQTVKSYLSGKKEYTDHYTFRACLANQSNTECIDNNVFGEELTAWVEEQNKVGNYPVLLDATVKEIKITTPFYRGQPARTILYIRLQSQLSM